MEIDVDTFNVGKKKFPHPLSSLINISAPRVFLWEPWHDMPQDYGEGGGKEHLSLHHFFPMLHLIKRESVCHTLSKGNTRKEKNIILLAIFYGRIFGGTCHAHWQPWRVIFHLKIILFGQ
jgi:hypothetical protein